MQQLAEQQIKLIRVSDSGVRTKCALAAPAPVFYFVHLCTTRNQPRDLGILDAAARSRSIALSMILMARNSQTLLQTRFISTLPHPDDCLREATPG